MYTHSNTRYNSATHKAEATVQLILTLRDKNLLQTINKS